jgi:tetratricopeptide (TPR) repeat protein
MTTHGRIGLFLILLFGSMPSVSAQSASQLYAEGVQLETNFQELSALYKYRNVLLVSPNHQQALYKCCELMCRIGARESNKKNRDIYFQGAIMYANVLLNLFPNHDETYVALAMSMGRIALTKSGKEKIAMVKDIRNHAERAIAINPSNFKAWHILGKWHYEVSNLSFIEETAVKLFYGGLPDASFTKSIQAYEKARVLHAQFALNYLELAKAYNKKDNKPKAIEMLRLLLKLPIQTEDDPRIHREAKDLLNRWE